MTLRLATRRSPLALVQANIVQQRLANHGIESELVLVDTRGDRHHFTVEVGRGVLDTHSLCVELYADPLGEAHAFCQEMTSIGRAAGSGLDLYVASVPANRAVGDYTARIVPIYSGVQVPLEAPYVLWAR